MTKTFLALHERLHREGVRVINTARRDGLCHIEFRGGRLRDDQIFAQVMPLDPDRIRLSNNRKCTVYWGSNSADSKAGVYTPLRQTLVLLCAAMNNEL